MRVKAAQHFDDYKKCHKLRPEPDSDLSSFMWDHIGEHHDDGQEPSNKDFKFPVIKQFTDPMTRQHEEAVRIKLSLSDNLHIDSRGRSSTIVSLNRKNEYFSARRRVVFGKEKGLV